MTNPRQPDSDALLQLAALEAFGLLDEFESAEYTRWFDDAPASVQDDIVEFQAMLASDEALLPDEEPPARLRDRVLSVVAEAVENESHRLAPLARIGGRRLGESGSRIGLGRSGQFWRAAAFALAAALIVCLYFINDVLNDSGDIAKLALSYDTDARLRELIGPGFEEFRNHPDRAHRVLRPSDGSPGVGVVYLIEGTKQAYLVTVGLPKDDGPYTLAMQTEAGEQTLETFRASGVIGEGVRIDGVPSNLLAAAAWVVTNAAGEVVLTSA